MESVWEAFCWAVGAVIFAAAMTGLFYLEIQMEKQASFVERAAQWIGVQ